MKKTLMLTAVVTVAAFFVAANAATANNFTKTSSIAAAFATPPAKVSTAFRAIFGNVPVQEWKLRSNGNWRAHFMRNGRAWEATFTTAGVLVKSEPA